MSFFSSKQVTSSQKPATASMSRVKADQPEADNVQQDATSHPTDAAVNNQSIPPMGLSEAGPHKQQFLLPIFIGLLILAVSGLLSTFVEYLLIDPNFAFLDRSAATSTRMFLSLSGVKVLVAVIESVPIVGKFAEALSDMVDFSWWGCFISMIVLKLVGFFFTFLKYLGRWPAIFFALSGGLLTWIHLNGYKCPLVRKSLSVIFAVTCCIYFLLPILTFSVAKVSDALEQQRGTKIETATETLKIALAWENIPNYMTRGGAEIRKTLPDWIGGISEEEYFAVKQMFDDQERKFEERTKRGIEQLSDAIVLYLAEKALACFLFPFVLLWGGWKLVNILCKQLDIPFNYEFNRLITPPETISNENLRSRAKNLIGRFKFKVKS